MSVSLKVIKDPKRAGLRFDDQGLIPAVVQDHEGGEVLMVAYMNQESLQKTLETGRTWFYSRSRRELWEKGRTSGNVQEVTAVYFDCDADTLLIRVKAAGPACHRGSRSCFEGLLARRRPEGEGLDPGMDQGLEKNRGKGREEGLEEGTAKELRERVEAVMEPHGDLAAFPFALEEIIRERRRRKDGKSYVASLFDRGMDAVLKKVGEEAGEVIIAAKNGDREELVYEAADLLFHLLLALQAGGAGYGQVLAELRGRHRERVQEEDAND